MDNTIRQGIFKAIKFCGLLNFSNFCGFSCTSIYVLYAAAMAYSLTTAVRGYHIYREFWMTNLEEVLPCVREESNPHDPFAVAIHDGSNIVGHVPRKFSALCVLFIQRDDIIACQMIGSKQYSMDLSQGGLEIPCVLTFSGEQREVLKVQKLVEEINAYITTNSDEQPNKGEKINFSKVSPSKSAADKTKHLDRDTTGGDLNCKWVV